jgi:hypothetical protein
MLMLIELLPCFDPSARGERKCVVAPTAMVRRQGL